MRDDREGLPPSAKLGGNNGEGERSLESALRQGEHITGARDAREGRAQHGPTGGPLPCQDSHNCTEGAPKPLNPEVFPSSAARTAFALQTNVADFCDRHGIATVGFLTLTFADHVLDPKEAQRRMHSLTTHVLRPRYGNTIRVIERQKSGRIHYHLLVAVGRDIRTGCDFDAFAKRDYRTAPPALRAEWSFWRETAKRYRFGRTELLPVRSTNQALGRYVGKYIAKHIGKRKEQDKRVRLVTYSGTKSASTRFGWAGGRSQLWRTKAKAFARFLHDCGAIDAPTSKAMAKTFGPRWVWKWRDSIMTFEPPQETETCPINQSAKL